MSKPSIILVHGAWADGSSWSKVIPILRDKGLEVTAVQLPLTSLADDVAVVRRAIALAPEPVVLVGHSYGGCVVTDAGTEAKVKALVYVAAWVPDSGESLGALGQQAPAAPLNSDVRPDGEGFLKISETGICESFAQDLDAADQTIIYTVQGPTHANAFGASIASSSPAWREKPSWYLVARQDRAIQPDLERKFASKIGASTVELDCGHLAMFSKAEETAELICEAVDSLQQPMEIRTPVTAE